MKLEIACLGQVDRAEIRWGDLTVMIGPQASGKSLIAQTWKLVLDAPFIQSLLHQYGYTWETPGDFLWLYFGSGYERIGQDNTRIAKDGKEVELQELANARRQGKPYERVFYIPAQRVLSLAGGYGWPLPFKRFEPGTPFVLAQYSEENRKFLDECFPDDDDVIFPSIRYLPDDLRDRLFQSVYRGVTLIAERNLRERLVLEVQDTGARLPFASWSAGQQGFTPLLLGLYQLLPTELGIKRGAYEWVVIEEPETGLHPNSIEAVLLAIAHLLKRGYRVILTTSSETIVECLWLVQRLRRARPDQSSKALAMYLYSPSWANRLPTVSLEQLELSQSFVQKDVRVYFSRPLSDGKVVVADISSLDAWDENPDVAGWGGLTTSTEMACHLLPQALSGNL